MNDTQPPKKATWGQRTQLERLGSDVWVLVGEQLRVSDPLVYRLVERGTEREIHRLTIAMVASLEQEGWIKAVDIERDPASGRMVRWGYRITLEGIRARDRGWQE